MRHFSENSANIGFRDGYLGSENNWGSLAMPGDPRYANIQNRPKANDVYQVPQNGGYDVVDGRRQRINGQAVLQFRPVDSLVATIDYTYSRETVDIRDDSVGIWYNHNDTSSAWTNGPVAGPIFYTERFQQAEGKDLAYSASQTAYRSENKSLGGNLTWKGPSGVTITLDAHHSTAESKPDSPYGNSNSFGTAVFGIQTQTINFDHQLPVISFTMYPGIDPLNPAQHRPDGQRVPQFLFPRRDQPDPAEGPLRPRPRLLRQRRLGLRIYRATRSAPPIACCRTTPGAARAAARTRSARRRRRCCPTASSTWSASRTSSRG